MGRLSVLVFLSIFLLLQESHSCQRKHIKGFFEGNKKEPEVHHHNYHHHYDKDGNEIPPPYQGGDDHPPPEAALPYYGDEEEPQKHVVVLQPLPHPPPQEDEGFFDSIIPKKFHPKHILKHHIHKLRDRFRDLLGEKKERVHAKFHHHHGGGGGKQYHKSPPQPPPHYYQQGGGHQAVPAVKVPLVQVEAYKPASPHQHPYHQQPKAVAYVSPDGYQPAVVVRQKPHYVHAPPPPPPPPQQPHPSPVEYQYQPVYENKPQAVSYQPQAQPQYHSHPPPQQVEVTYPSQDEGSYHQSTLYGPQSQQSYSYSAPPSSSFQHFGHSPAQEQQPSPFSFSSGGATSFTDSSSSLYQ